MLRLNIKSGFGIGNRKDPTHPHPENHPTIVQKNSHSVFNIVRGGLTASLCFDTLAHSQTPTISADPSFASPVKNILSFDTTSLNVCTREEEEPNMKAAHFDIITQKAHSKQ